MKEIDEIIKDIKAVRIQGARNVAKAGIRALILTAKKSKATNKEELHSELIEVARKVSETRPTEPMLRNVLEDAVRFTAMEIAASNEDIEKIKESIVEESEEYLKKMRKGVERIWEYGAKVLPTGGNILTHCHSSTVTGIFKKAYDMGKEFKVVACETRPLYQGRITAKELANYGIDVTLTVDMGVSRYMKKADMVLVGADAITSMGDLINKIGTSTLARIARMNDVSFFSAAETYKFDPLTIYGVREKIEVRDYKEVWEKKPKNITIENYAFDATASRYINGYITEVGVLSPQSFWAFAMKKLGKEVGV